MPIQVAPVNNVVPVATASTRGVSRLSLAAASPGDPISVGDNDSRLTDSRSPTTHATTHEFGGSDPVGTATPTAHAIPYASVSGTFDIGWLPLGNSSSTVTVGNDSRLPPSPGTNLRLLKDNGSSWVASAAGTASQVYAVNSGATDTVFETVGGDLSKSGTTWTIGSSAVTTSKINTSAVTYAKLQNETGLTIVGNPSTSSAAPSEIGAATASQVLACNSGATALAFETVGGDLSKSGTTWTIGSNAVTTSKINNSAVTYAKIQNETALTLLGNPTSSSAAPAETNAGTASQVVAINSGATAIVFETVGGDLSKSGTTWTIANGAVTAAKASTGTSSSTLCVGNDTRLNTAPTAALKVAIDTGSAWNETAAGTASQVLAINSGASTVAFETVGGDLSKSGTTWTIANGAVTAAKASTGSTSSTLCIGNDSRLSDSRAPNGSASGDLAGTYPSPTVAQSSTSFALNGIISPSQITSNQNDYNPTSLSTASQLRINTDASRNITGLQGGAAGRIVTIINVGSNDVVLTDSDSGSSAANRFGFGSNITLAAKQSVLIQYDGTSSLWRQIGAARTAFGTAANTTCQGNDTRLNTAPTAALKVAVDTGSAWSETSAGTASQVCAVNSGATAVAFETVGGDLSKSGTTWTIGSNAVTTSKINNSAITYAKIQNETALTMLGNPTSSAAAPAETNAGTASQILAVNSGATSIAFETVGGDLSKSGTTWTIANGAVTAAKASTGSTSATLCIGNDSRLSDSRAPNGSAGGDLAGTYPNPTVAQSSTAFALSGVISPSQITSNQNDYNPTSLSGSSQLRLNTDASRNITGLQGGATGRILTILNVGSNDIVLTDSDTNSSAANRFGFGAAITLAAKQALTLQYDGTSSLWRQAGASRRAFGTAANTDCQGNDTRLNTAPTAALKVAVDTGSAWSETSAGTASQVLAVNSGATAIAFETVGGDLSKSSTTWTIGSNAVTTSKINNSAVTYAKIQNETALTLLGNPTSSTAAPAETNAGTASQIVAVNSGATAIAFETVGGDLSKSGTTWTIANSAVTAAKASTGSTSSTLCIGNDSRLSDSRAPNGTAGGDLAGTYPNPTVAQSSTAFALSGVISPSQITSNQNDYNPTSLSGASQLRLNTDASRNITGLQGGATGRLLTVVNVGSNDIVLTDSDSSSSAANRFGFGANITIAAKQALFIQYDGTSSLWRQAGASRRAFGTAANTDCQGNDTRLNTAPTAALKVAVDTGSAWSETGAGTASQVLAVNSGATSVVFETVGGDLSKSGTTWTIGSNAVTTSKINNSAVTYAKIQNETALTLLGNPTSSSAAPAETNAGTASQVVAVNSGATAIAFETVGGDLSKSGTTWTIGSNAVTTSKINNAAVTYAKIQNETALTLLGNPTSSTAAPAETNAGTASQIVAVNSGATAVAFETVGGNLSKSGTTWTIGSGQVTDSMITGGGILPTGCVVPTAANKAPTNWLLCDGTAVSRTTYANLFTAIAPSLTGVTITIASPAVITWTAHGLNVNDPVQFYTTTTLPTGIVSGTVYFVTVVVDANSFKIGATPGGSNINTSGTQSGTHRAISAPYGDGNGSTGTTFNVPDLRGRFPGGVDAMTGGTAASRLTSAGSGIKTSPGQTGGAETHTLATGELPSHNHSVTDPGHFHTINALISSTPQGTGAGNPCATTTGNINSDSKTTGITIGNTGSGTAFSVTPPALMFNWIIRI